jgi:hypothetical protein
LAATEVSEKLSMLHFLDAAVDGEWMAELKDAGLLAPDQIDRIDELMGRPESGSLNAFLLAGADLVPEKPWLTWLIRRHGCHRYGKAAWRGESLAWQPHGIPPDGNLPYRQGEDGALLVAVLRPDLLPATGERLQPRSWLRAAATLREMRDLHRAWEGPR